MAINPDIQKLLQGTYEETTAIGILKRLGVQNAEQTLNEKLKDAVFQQILKSFSYTIANDLIFEKTLDAMERFEKNQTDIKDKRRYFGNDLPNLPIQQIEKIYQDNEQLSKNYQKLKRAFLKRYENAQVISNKIKNLCFQQVDKWNRLNMQHADDICMFLDYKNIQVSEEFFQKLTDLMKKHYPQG